MYGAAAKIVKTQTQKQQNTTSTSSLVWFDMKMTLHSTPAPIDTTTTTKKSMGFDPNAINLVLQNRSRISYKALFHIKMYFCVYIKLHVIPYVPFFKLERMIIE